MTSAMALLMVLFFELMGQALAQEWLCGTEGGLAAGGGSPELCFSAAVLLQPLSTLQALRPKEGRMPCQFLTSILDLSPGADGARAQWVHGCSDPCAGTGAGLWPLMDQGSDPPLCAAQPW